MYKIENIQPKVDLCKILKTDEEGKITEELVEQEQSFADILGRLFIDKYGLSENYKTSLLCSLIFSKGSVAGTIRL